MPLDPLQTPCLHIATTQELDRDPDYTACAAAPGQPCLWAKRHDGFPDPPFHAERLESAATLPPIQSNLPFTPDPEALREAILDTGLV